MDEKEFGLVFNDGRDEKTLDVKKKLESVDWKFRFVVKIALDGVVGTPDDNQIVLNVHDLLDVLEVGMVW